MRPADPERIAEAWYEAANDLGIEVISPFQIISGSAVLEVVAMIPQFGAPGGMVLMAIGDPAEHEVIRAVRGSGGSQGFSVLSRSYENYDRDRWVDTLNDWGWAGEPSTRPPWCTDEPLS